MVGTNSCQFDRASELKAFDDTKSGVKGLVDAEITEIPRIFHLPPGTLSDKKPSVPNLDLAISTIDLEGIDKDANLRKNVVEKIRNAAEKWGFFQVINHGVPLSVLEELRDGVCRFHEEDSEAKKRLFSRDFTKKVVYNSNFDLYSSQFANWRDTLTCYMAPNPPKPEELPAACREVIIEYSKH